MTSAQRHVGDCHDGRLDVGNGQVDLDQTGSAHSRIRHRERRLLHDPLDLCWREIGIGRQHESGHTGQICGRRRGAVEIAQAAGHGRLNVIHTGNRYRAKHVRRR